MFPLVALAAVFAAVAGAVAWLRRVAPAPRDPAALVALERAVALIDRELAADLELMAMFDQTKQAFVLENGQFLAAGPVLAHEAPEAYASAAEVYGRIPAVETSMERRGPAGSIPDADLHAIHEWEGDVREARRVLRASLMPPRRSRWSLLVERLGARSPVR